MARSVVFATAGGAFFVYWYIVRPTNQATAQQSEWPYVLWFSATILTLAFAAPLFGRMVGGRWTIRFSWLAGIGAAANSVVNIIEDGFGQDWAFMLFVAGSATTLLGLLGAAITIAFESEGKRRLLALVPLGSAAGIVLFTTVGSSLLAACWGAAAIVSWREGGPTRPTGA